MLFFAGLFNTAKYGKLGHIVLWSNDFTRIYV